MSKLDSIQIIIWGLLVMLSCYKLGEINAKSNVYNYIEISPSIRLACSAMVDNKPVEDVKYNLRAYNFIRKYKVDL